MWLLCLWLSLPGFIFASVLIDREHLGVVAGVLILSFLLLYIVLLANALTQSLMRPLQSLTNVVGSLREGDYSLRVRRGVPGDTLAELVGEVNALADLLRSQRVHSLEATALLARILEGMHTPLFAFDRQENLQIVNPAGADFLGRNSERCIGRSATELGLEKLLQAADQSVHTVGEHSKRWLLRKSTFRQSGMPHTLLLFADVSLPLQEEQQIAWKRLISVLGHELSNSLAPIKSIAGSLLARMDTITGESDTLRDFRRGLAVVESRADTLHRFVQSYRLLAQLPPPQLRSVALGALVERVVLLEQRVAVQLNAGPAVTLHADPDQLEQMLINLLANAADATLANQASSIRVGWSVANGFVSLWLEDNGLGIANKDNLFVPFYTTKQKGSGIGLVLSQQIARAHGGEIDLVNRNDGEGARATVRLPIQKSVGISQPPAQ